jgi:hypothetical protein
MLDSSNTLDGQPTMLVASAAGATSSTFATASAFNYVPSTAFGKNYRVRAQVKTENAQAAYLWFSVYTETTQVLANGINPTFQAIVGTSDWQWVDQVLAVPDGAVQFSFGSILAGTGEVWVGPITLEEVAACVPLSESGTYAIPTDAGVSTNDAGTASSVPACAETVSSFAPPAWKPPTPFHQGACTSAEADTYAGCLGAADCTSGSSSCDACIQTDVGAAAYGPVITGSSYGDGFGSAFVNWGGCQANIDGNTAAGSCGSETNAWQACANAVCPASTCGSSATACETYAYDGPCAGHTESEACAGEWSSTTSEVPTCSNFATLATMWCGQ